jgi:3-oxoacyl-[acyl-carrier protein] reductase
MDLEIAGRRALVCGASRGLGWACAAALARAGVEVTINARNATALQEAADRLSSDTGAKVKIAPGDVASVEGRRAVLGACPPPDILVNNAGGPPPGSFENWEEADWLAALRTNMIGPIMLIRDTIGHMSAQRWGRIVNITSGAVKAPLPLLGLSNGARAGLTGFVAGLAREVAGRGITLNNLLPGYFATDRLRTYVQALAQKQGVSADQAWQNLGAANPTGSIGRPADFGSVCAFMVSEHARYITGQNILLDGGAFPGTF